MFMLIFFSYILTYRVHSHYPTVESPVTIENNKIFNIVPKIMKTLRETDKFDITCIPLSCPNLNPYLKIDMTKDCCQAFC